MRDSLEILVYPVTAILKTEESNNNNSNIFSLDEISEILREFESASIFSKHLAEAIQEFLTGRNGVPVMGAKKLNSNNSSSK